MQLDHYFTSPSLSKKLEQLGVDNTLNFHTCKSSSEPHEDGFFAACNDMGDEKVFHFSDILLESGKIWDGEIVCNSCGKGGDGPCCTNWENSLGSPRDYRMQFKLLEKIYLGADWQSWIESEVDQALNQSNHKEV